MTEIAAAIERADHEVALGEAIAAWRPTRDAVLADLVDALAARCKPAPIAGRTKEAYQRAWIELAKRAGDDPMAIGALVAGLVKSVPVAQIRYLARGRDVKRYRAFLERIDALAACDDDPRTASALAELLERAPFSVEDVGGVYGPAIDLLIRIADPRSVARLRALVERPVAKTATIRGYFADALVKAADAIERTARRRRGLADADRAAAAQLLARLGAPRPAIAEVRPVDLDQLLADCLANPDDDGPREVLADALLERDDPRGELIQLQLRDARRELGEPERKRADSIKRKHEKTWLGDLTRVTKRRIFRRGFLDECELLQGASADGATWERVANDPILATVRALHKGSASEELYRSFVFSPAMSGLREIEVTSTAMLRDLARPIEHVTLTAGLTKDALRELDAIAKRTGMTRLSFEVKSTPDALVEQLVEWGARARFRELCAIPHYRVMEAWVTDANRWLLAFDRLAPVKRLGIGRRGDRTIVERGAKGLCVDIDASQESPIVQLAASRGLPPIEKLVVRGTPEAWFPPTAAFARAIAKFPAAVVELHDGWIAHAPRR